MSKFKVGDLVYCLPLTHKISKITRANEDNDVFLNEAGWFKNTGLNHNDMPIIFHATQENYELISKLYSNVEFEPPPFEPSPKSPKRKEPKEIIKAMLESGWEYVPVIDLRDSHLYFANQLDINRQSLAHLVPFDPKTGKVGIDFVDGEVVLESGNADK